MFGLAAVSVAQDTVQDTETAGLCTGFVAQDPQTKQALKIQVGSATREDCALAGQAVAQRQRRRL